jgi:redox-sensing transcriptional repressor
MVNSISYKTIGRLILYWRILRDLLAQNKTQIHSHELAAQAKLTAAQVRRDLMTLGYSGTPARGYDVVGLKEHIEKFIFPTKEQRAVLAGVGNLGRALLKFFQGRRPNLRIVASLETNPEKFGGMIQGCPCYSIEEATRIIREQEITVGIIAVPDSEAQYVADVFVKAGIRGILNFARTPLHVPSGIYVEDVDLAMSLDRVAYFARQAIKTEKSEADQAVIKERGEE